MLNTLSKNWWMLVVRGIAAILFGLLAIIMPGLTLIVLVLMFGAYALIDGVMNVISAWNSRSQYDRWWIGLLEGAVGILFGILTFIWPGITGMVLLYLIAFWAVMTGVMEIAAAIQLRKEIENEWLLGISGALSIIFGVLLVLFPAGGALAVAWVIGIYAMIFGAALIALGFQLRNRVPGTLREAS